MMQEYDTNSFYLACYLASEGGMKLIRVDRPPGSRQALFVFEDTADRQVLVNKFILDEDATVNVKDFVFQIRRLKSALYDGI